MAKPSYRALSREARGALASAINLDGLRATARAARVNTRTLERALRGERVSDTNAARLSRVAPKTRSAADFPTPRDKRAPRNRAPQHSWSLETIRAARDAQMKGDFTLPVRLAEACRTDDALFTAYHSRLAPQAAIATQLVPATGARGASVAAAAARHVHVAGSTLAGINGTLANHGIAIGHIERAANADGTIVEMRALEWPLESVRWDASREVLTARVLGGLPVDVIHGDGEWIVIRKFLDRPWTQDAAILAAAFVWAAHAEGLADWNSVTRAHGMAKLLGIPPEGFDLALADGTLSAQGQAMLDMLSGLVSGEGPVGIAPHGSEIKWQSNGSTAWQVFNELVGNREKAAARIYTGTDAQLGSVGGAPGVDIAALFGVKTTIVQGDFAAIEQALNTGLYEPWTAINYGDSRYSPRLHYEMPDIDSDAKRAEKRSARERLHATLREMREQKLELTQDTLNALAAELGVSPAPKLEATGSTGPTSVLAPTDQA